MRRPDGPIDQVKIYGICLVKNEDDIIAQTLAFGAEFCERIFVLDNGSTDDTWTIVQALARQNRKIVPFGQTFGPFDNSLRATVYNALHGEISEHDWWMILDADEFLAEDPLAVIDTAVKSRADVINTWQIQFFFTEHDAQAWADGRDRRDLPIVDRRRHYLINWQETRLFRNDPQRGWDIGANRSIPAWLGRACRRRLLNRHYQYRDPEQMAKRIALRQGHPLFPHVGATNSQHMIRDSRSLNFHRDGEPWRFSPSGLWYFYRRQFYLRTRWRIMGAP